MLVKVVGNCFRTTHFSFICMEKSYMENYKEISQKTEEYVEMNKLTVNGKTNLIFFSRNNSDFGSIFYENEVLTTQKCCRYLDIQIDRNLNFDEQLSKPLKKMAHAIRSIYLIRHQISLNARILLLKSPALSHLSFSAIFFQYLSQFFTIYLQKKPETL